MSLSVVRREAVELLCRAQADGRISEQLFEQRLEAVQAAPSDASILAIVADLQDTTPGFGVAAQEPAAPVIPVEERLRVSSVLTSTRREGNWVVPYQLELLSLLGEMHIDFRDAIMADDLIEVHVSVGMGSIVLRVPPGTAIRNEVDAILGSSEIKRKSRKPVPPGGLTLRVTGNVVLGSLEIREG